MRTALATLTLILVAGCGGGDASPPTTTADPVWVMRWELGDDTVRTNMCAAIRDDGIDATEQRLADAGLDDQEGYLAWALANRC